MNHELHQLLGEPTIVHLAKFGMLGWAGHVTRMSDNNPVKMVLENNLCNSAQDDMVRSGQDGSIILRTICAPFAECVAGDKQSWTESNGDVYYVEL